MNCGTVLFDKKYQFPNGTVGEKLSVILSEFGTNYLVAKTTSQQHSKHTADGCQINDKPPNYFLPRGSCWFDRDTWIELDDVYELDSTIHGYKRLDGTAIEHDNALDVNLMKAILDCALQSEDIEQFYLDILKPAREKLDAATPQAEVPANPKSDS